MRATVATKTHGFNHAPMTSPRFPWTAALILSCCVPFSRPEATGGAALPATPGTRFHDAQRDGTAGPEMVVVPAGTFSMGTLGSSGADDERPAHAVTFTRPFALGRFEITVAEYGRFLSATGRPVPNAQATAGRQIPAMDMSWDDAAAYARWLAAETGKPYRLPSEAEWEYAARGGRATEYHFGDDPLLLCSHANVADSAFRARYPEFDWSLPCADGHAEQAPVGSYRPNAFGLHDMHGNVSEWNADCWNESYAGAPADGSAWIIRECGSHVQRGGSYFDAADVQRARKRYGTYHEHHETDIGLRVARDL